MTTVERASVRRLKVTDRDDTGRRLLASSAKLSYDPVVEVDWDAPLDPDLYGLTPEWSTLFGTPMWEGMTHQQRVTLTLHEGASIGTTGLWFEMILMQMLLRDVYGRDPSSAHVQFALTEIADECRHSVMFARAADKVGAHGYLPPKVVVELGRLFGTTSGGPSAYAGILLAEEVLDVMQRDFQADPRVQPMVRTISKIHVVEEARHMRFAREEIVRRVQTTGRVQRERERVVLAATGYVIVTNLIRPQVYAAAGLDVAEAVAQARTNTHHHEKLRAGSAKLMAFLTECGLVGGPSAALYRRAHMA